MQIKRGEIYLVDLGEDNKVGSEQKFQRPVLVVSNNTGHKYSTIFECVVITTKPKHPLPTHAELKTDTGLREISVALCEHIVTLDIKRIVKLIGEVKDMRMVNQALKVSLDLC